MQADGQPRNFAPHRIAMHRAAGDRLVQHLGRLLERLLRLRLVGARSDSFRSGLGQRAGTCANDAVALSALKTLPMTFLGRRMNGNMRHNQSFLTVREGGSNTSEIDVRALCHPERSEASRAAARFAALASVHRASISDGVIDLRSRPRDAAILATSSKRATNLSQAARSVVSASLLMKRGAL